MKRSIFNTTQTILFGCALSGLAAVRANCQIPLRQGTATQVNSGLIRSIAFGPFYAPYAYRSVATNPYYGGPVFANPYSGLNPYTAVAKVYTSNGNAIPPPPPTSAAQPQMTRAAAGTVTAQYYSATELLVQWSGDVSAVKQVTLGIFDTTGRMLSSQVIMRLPVQSIFALPSTAAYYGAQVQYLNGTINTSYAPIE